MNIIDNSTIKINIDGVEFSAKKGSKIIEIADEVGIYIPRFCYHKKLSVAANCRMCLVEIEKSPKLVAACATPVMDGMKIFTNTDKVIDAQRAVMEFLLINHPLDCPICDQGGECELQDLAVGYGCASSRFIEEKRAFEDYDLGPLVATDVTRCILCSRCVRFCAEIAGTEDLGIINRGSNSRIFTFLQQHLQSEISGNVIDLCPVGALTAKPSRFKFRPWELVQNSFISCHDCIGSNLYVHVFRDKIIRIVPKKNDTINESWISDKDRFSYEGLHDKNERLNYPMIKKNGKFENVSWNEALNYSAEKLNEIKKTYGPEKIGTVGSSSSTLEELYTLQKLMRTLGSNNIDHRLKQLDFTNQHDFPKFPGANINLDEIENINTVLIIGSDITKEQPIIALKLRKIINNGGQVFTLNPANFSCTMSITDKIIANPKYFPAILLEILENIRISSNNENKTINKYKKLTEAFIRSEKNLILLGSYVTTSIDYTKILALSIELTKLTDSKLGVLTDGANTAGAWIAGFIPHRAPGMTISCEKEGLNALDMFKAKLHSYILFGIEIEHDCLYANNAINALKNADFVLSFSSFKSKYLLDTADVILPIASSYEISGTFVNIAGLPQSFNAVIPHEYEVKQGWMAINDLAKKLKQPGFGYNSIEEILKEIKIITDIRSKITWNSINIENLNSKILNEFTLLPTISPYSTDPLVRRALSLQKTYIKNETSIRLNSSTYKKLKTNNNLLVIKNIEKENINKYVMLIDNEIADDTMIIDSKDTIDNTEFMLQCDKLNFEQS